MPVPVQWRMVPMLHIMCRKCTEWMEARVFRQVWVGVMTIWSQILIDFLQLLPADAFCTVEVEVGLFVRLFVSLLAGLS